MESSLAISSALFQLVNVPVLQSEITGKVYIGDFPSGDQLENVTINVLTNPNKYLQEGYCNLNAYVKEIKAGRPPLERFQSIINILIPLIRDASKDNLYFFQIDDDKGWFKDPDNDGIWFYNLRVAYQKH